MKRKRMKNVAEILKFNKKNRLLHSLCFYEHDDVNILCRIPVPNNIQTNLHRMITRKKTREKKEVEWGYTSFKWSFSQFFSLSLWNVMQFNFVCMRTSNNALNWVELNAHFMSWKKGVLQIPDLDPNSNHFVAMAVAHRVHRAMLVVHSLHSIRTNGVRTDHEFP